MSVLFRLWSFILRSDGLIRIHLLPLVTPVLYLIASFPFTPRTGTFVLSVSTSLPESLLLCLTALFFPVVTGQLGCKIETKQNRILKVGTENGKCCNKSADVCCSFKLALYLFYGGEIKHLPCKLDGVQPE